MRRRSDPHAAEPKLEPADEIKALGENLARLERPVAVSVLENDDRIAALPFRLARRITERLRHPQPPPRIDRERDRLVHVRLRGNQLRLKSRGERRAGDE